MARGHAAMNSKTLRRLLTSCHQRRAAKLDCAIFNLGWVLTEDAICSKTTLGYLTTKRLGSRLYKHEITSYD